MRLEVLPQLYNAQDIALDPGIGIPGPTFDASVLATTEEQALFDPQSGGSHRCPDRNEGKSRSSA